jgi:transaldolase/glucose-6-phosphate isomerase
MTMTKYHQLAELGQSIWLDYIRRSFITSGELQAWIDKGLRGVTSNPSIFEKAIAGSADYDPDLRRLVAKDRSVNEIYEALALEDIARVADLLRPVYERTNGLDGYVSLEASPALAHDTAGTLAEIRHFAAALNRPNVMFKVPATPAGIPAIESLIVEGINVNVTLIFSVAQYEAVAEAYLSGLEKWVASGGDPSQVASVASFFVSRVDTAVDLALADLGHTELQGQIAIANAKAAYARFRQILSGARWQRLAARGARVQRLLWGSTSAKNPLYPDTLYVDGLIGPHTVNTVPPATLQAFLDHGTVAPTLQTDVDKALDQLARLGELGVDLDAVTRKLLDDGVAQFARAFESLMDSITEKRERLLAGWEQLSAALGDDQPAVDKALSELADHHVLSRIWSHDHTVWKEDPAEIGNRLGWLHIADKMIDNVACLEAFADDVRAEGYTHALLLGMGGSSLAPEVLRKTFGARDGYLDLAVLDSTDPAAVLAYTEGLDPARTLFIVSTKSGNTVETFSSFKFFYNRVADAVGEEEAGRHFVAITDPGTRLADLAKECDFRTTFLNDPNIGGRYSALSYFGLVPAALIGVDLETLLDRALTMACNCEACNCPVGGNNAAALLGAIVGALANAGRDKLTVIASPSLASFGDWVEQLIAESTGKDGKGILPVVREPLGSPAVYGDDRLFVYLRLDGDGDPSAGSGQAYDAAVQALQDAGHPLVRVHLRDLYDLGQQFFLWEMATAVASYYLRINPFNQPNVEAAKVLARQMVAAYKAKGTLPAVETAPLDPKTLQEFLAQAQRGDYIALQAYVQPNAETDAALLALRTRLRDQYRLATTAGYGPRFLHSTGQLHKGDAGNGLFIQLTADSPRDAPIPDDVGATDSSITFGVLKAAQALGDYQALLDVNRRVVRFHLGTDVVGGLRRLADALS